MVFVLDVSGSMQVRIGAAQRRNTASLGMMNIFYGNRLFNQLCQWYWMKFDTVNTGQGDSELTYSWHMGLLASHASCLI